MENDNQEEGKNKILFNKLIKKNKRRLQSKAKEIFNLINNFRKNPRELAKNLEIIRTYLDPDTNILSEPNKIKIQMVEGDKVFKEAIQFRKFTIL